MTTIKSSNNKRQKSLWKKITLNKKKWWIIAGAAAGVTVLALAISLPLTLCKSSTSFVVNRDKVNKMQKYNNGKLTAGESTKAGFEAWKNLSTTEKTTDLLSAPVNAFDNATIDFGDSSDLDDHSNLYFSQLALFQHLQFNIRSSSFRDFHLKFFGSSGTNVYDYDTLLWNVDFTVTSDSGIPLSFLGYDLSGIHFRISNLPIASFDYKFAFSSCQDTNGVKSTTESVSDYFNDGVSIEGQQVPLYMPYEFSGTQFELQLPRSMVPIWSILAANSKEVFGFDLSKFDPSVPMVLPPVVLLGFNNLEALLKHQSVIGAEPSTQRFMYSHYFYLTTSAPTLSYEVRTRNYVFKKEIKDIATSATDVLNVANRYAQNTIAINVYLDNGANVNQFVTGYDEDYIAQAGQQRLTIAQNPADKDSFIFTNTNHDDVKSDSGTLSVAPTINENGTTKPIPAANFSVKCLEEKYTLYDPNYPSSSADYADSIQFNKGDPNMASTPLVFANDKAGYMITNNTFVIRNEFGEAVQPIDGNTWHDPVQAASHNWFNWQIIGGGSNNHFHINVTYNGHHYDPIPADTYVNYISLKVNNSKNTWQNVDYSNAFGTNVDRNKGITASFVITA